MQNENGFDRLARVILGVIVLLMVFVGPKTPLGWLGLIPLITGLIGFCPLYRLLGINTCRKRR